MFLNSFNHFRAIAVTFIVASHCFEIAGILPTTFFNRFMMNLIYGGTILFVFISGFLFHHVFYTRYSYQSFLMSKIKILLIPYTFLCIVPIALRVYTGDFFIPNGSGFYEEYIIPAGKYYITGLFLSVYWYIPFIFTVFLLSPLHIKFIQTPLKWQIVITVSMLIISALVHRPFEHMPVFQSTVFFFPIYLLGILCSMNKEFIYKTLKGKEIYLLAIVLFTAALQAYLGKFASYFKPPFEYGGIDLMLLQKVVLCLCFMVWLKRYDSYKSKLIDTLAKISFSIFFLHPYFLSALKKFTGVLEVESWIAYIALLVVTIGTCICIALIVKKIIPKYSRSLIGY